MQGIQDPPTQRGIIPRYHFSFTSRSFFALLCFLRSCFILRFFRSFEHIFETTSVSEASKFLIHSSYLEIYNEEIRDLLGKDIHQKLDLKEHPDKGTSRLFFCRLILQSAAETRGAQACTWRACRCTAC